MAFEKLATEVDSLIKELEAPAAAKKEEPPPAPVGKKMDAKAFAAYSQEQVAKAQKEHDAGKTDLSKQRLVALKTEVDKVQKFEFKPGELPTVTVYKDPEQLDTTEQEVALQAAASTPSGESNYTAKAANFSKYLGSVIEALGGSEGGGEKKKKPEDPNGDEEADRMLWPSDLAKCVRKDPRDEDKDYDFGVDAR